MRTGYRVPLVQWQGRVPRCAFAHQERRCRCSQFVVHCTLGLGVIMAAHIYLGQILPQRGRWYDLQQQPQFSKDAAKAARDAHALLSSSPAEDSGASMRACQWALLLPPWLGCCCSWPTQYRTSTMPEGRFPDSDSPWFYHRYDHRSCLLQLVACDPSSDGTCLLGLPRVLPWRAVEAGDGQNWAGREYDPPYTHFTLRLSDPSQSACGP